MGKTTKDFRRIVVEDIPLIDVRAPVEFAAGAFPNAVNLPLMNDEERRLVGICYKQKGQASAIELGHELVCGPIKASRIAAWKSFMEEHPSALIYCFRGGMRSQLSQQWAEEAVGGRDIQRLEGGCKAFRNYLIGHLDPAHLNSKPIVLGGRTGSGKTLLLQQLGNVVDLEAIANHRGSSFGRFINPQPTQIDFENGLAWALIQHEAAGHRHMVVEDEGRHVGQCYLPDPLVEHFNAADVVLLETPLTERVQITFDEYVTSAQALFSQAYGEDGLLQWLEDIRGSVQRIRKRLGGERLKRVNQLLQDAYDHQLATGEADAHKNWAELLLVEYYDPMYDYQLEQKRKKIVFQGNAEEVFHFITTLG
ncbi:tRNA 2-selenouridine(34) synthase MnmH [Pontiella sulfatireligans]|uniref:tRNA 2-selenouridine synthase n=1 Tax=Pontiella sulfatireligans TaxID=2750658 RepID=A0A6C2UMF2_9BACT|nr:tRNA 2-selenouridine(34) synthase MnmH [Pontiella sulfatireligans]VGO21452.1 tRNA 2-selenouridine synthase [Pontiella sulfatireligans]